MGILKDLHLVQGKSKTAEIFETLYPDFRNVNYNSPSQYVKTLWSIYQTSEVPKGNSQNGKLFEYIIATLLYRENILPFYLNAKITYVNDIHFDITLFNEKKNIPIVLSIKTTLRERYKQAELEALKLKDVHKGARSYIITIDDNVEYYLQKKEDGDIRLNDIVYVFSPVFDNFIYHLKNTKMCDAPTVPVLQSNMIVR